MAVFKSGSLICERFILGDLAVNTYLVYEEGKSEALLVDPGDDSQELLNRIKELNIAHLNIFLTHGHADHIKGVTFIKKSFPRAKVIITPEDAPMLTDAVKNMSAVIMSEPFECCEADSYVQDGDTIKLGDHVGVVRTIPGHTKGGAALVFDEMIFSGDTLFADSVGRSDFPGGNFSALINNIKEKLLTLSDRLVFPGHGSQTSIEHEKNNPYF